MSFKKVKVVMLSTNEKANLYLHETKGLHLLAAVEHKSGSYSGSNQHLYFLSDEEIKVGDWMFHTLDKKPIQWNGEETESNPSVYGYKKIIATTELLTSNINLPVGSFNYLPQPSQSFIEKFVEEYNKGNVITEVMVEYEELCIQKELSEPVHKGLGVYRYDESVFYNVLKVNPKDNTITIRKVKESWNREEVLQLLRIAFFRNGGTKTDFDKFIEEIF